MFSDTSEVPQSGCVSRSHAHGPFEGNISFSKYSQALWNRNAVCTCGYDWTMIGQGQDELRLDADGAVIWCFHESFMHSSGLSKTIFS